MINSPLSLEHLQYLREKYSSRQEGEEATEAFDDFIVNYTTSGANIDTTLKALIRFIHRFFGFEYVAIALRNEKDGLYRYVYSIGLPAEADSSYKKIAYSSSDLFDDATFPSVKICRFSRFYIAEKKPYKPGEESSYTRPNLLTLTRGHIDDMIEGDYIDIYLHKSPNDVMGYFELAGTRSGKLPEKGTIKQIELIAVFISRYLQNEHRGIR